MSKQTKQNKLTKKEIAKRLIEFENDPDSKENLERFANDESVLREELLNDAEFDNDEWLEVWEKWVWFINLGKGK